MHHLYVHSLGYVRVYEDGVVVSVLSVRVNRVAGGAVSIPYSKRNTLPSAPERDDKTNVII